MRVAIFLLLCGITPLANAAGMMDTLVSQVQGASGGWMATALGYATNLFFGLAALEFAWSAIQLTLKKSELSEIMVGTLFKVMSLSFFAMVLIKAPEWIPAIINSFKAAGAGVGGTSVLSPSAVFDQGLQVAASLMQFSNDAAPSTGDMIINTLTNSGQGLGKFMLSAIIVGVASVFIVLGYGLIAVQLLITLVESYLIIGGGALMLGFSGSRWTHNLSEKYFGYAISVGVKLFTIYLIIGFGDSFTQALKDTIAAAYAAHPEGPSFGDYLGVGGASLFYGVTGYMAPGLAGSMLNGTVAMSLQSAGTAAGMVGGAPVAAGLATSAAGARALGLAGGAMGALMPIQKAAGAIGGSSAGVGFGGGISGAVNAINPFQSGSGPSNTSNITKSSNANSGGTGIAPFLALPGPSVSPTASSSASQSARARTPSEGSGPDSAAPGPSESPMAGRGMNASGQSLGQTQAPGFVDPRFDPSAMQSGDTKQSTNETGGTSANSFDVRSLQQRFEADYKQHPGGLADKLNSFSKRLQHAADRRKPHWVSDGHVGHAPGLRMGLDA
ncbi:MAG: P-type conjugative transfer protein TrbL [Comamonadaceae bacterium CG12_big_fil_rev_8_21_14_0_65_59_15]|nr:MAG: P-type conjugative transfer protein TrbL [Comamonadaceae bacterium CG12_big_fil_rev_8_21_14_0_65_59_15]